MRANAFLLSMLSPVWRVKLCRGDLFEACSSRTLKLRPSDREAFLHAVDLGCGLEAEVRGGLAGLMAVGRLADAYGMEEVCAAAEEAVLARLSVDTCADALMLARNSGLGRVEAGCRAVALGRFEAVAGTAGFGRLDAAALGGLLGDAGLVAGCEERVLEALARWLRAHSAAAAAAVAAASSSFGPVGSGPAQDTHGPTGAGGAEHAGALLGLIRFSRMRKEYLAALCDGPRGAAAVYFCSSSCSDGQAEGALAAAAAAEESGAGDVLREMAEEALASRTDAASGDCDAGEESAERAGAAGWRRLSGEGRAGPGTAAEAFSVAVCGGRVWCGGWDGTIRIWSRKECGPAAAAGGPGERWHRRVVSALAVWGGYVLSGSADSRIGVWDGGSGRCAGFLPGGHVGGVNALAVRAPPLRLRDCDRVACTAASRLALTSLPEALAGTASEPLAAGETGCGRRAAERRRRRGGAGLVLGWTPEQVAVRRRPRVGLRRRIASERTRAPARTQAVIFDYRQDPAEGIRCGRGRRPHAAAMPAQTNRRTAPGVLSRGQA